VNFPDISWRRAPPLSVDDFARLAQRSVPRFVFDYVEGGAEDERCRRRNVEDLADLTLLPRQLRDTRRLDLSVKLFGRVWRAPFGIAPVGLAGLIRPHGDLQLARAAAAHGVPFVLSTASSARLEQVREAAPDAILWQQLYVMSDRRIAEQLVRRAREARFEALVLTVDVPVSGHRRRDVRNGFALPLRPTPDLLLDVLRRPGWALRLLRGGLPMFPNLSDAGSAQPAQASASLLAREMDRGLTWDSLAWLRGLWDGPLLLKGVLHPDDARRALRHGVDGLIVSNHGGRQLDAAPSTISSLPAIADAVAGRVPVLADSGFRRGSDVVKACALGAQAVLLGRAPLYGLCHDGERGVGAVLDLLAQDLARNMILLGLSATSEISSGLVPEPPACPDTAPAMAGGLGVHAV
jgi:(S)-mandelate dehydrogenase